MNTKPKAISKTMRRLCGGVAFALVALTTVGAAAQDRAGAARFYEDALVRYEKQDFAGAIIQLKNALKLDKALLPVHVLLGKTLIANEDFAAAQVALEEALRLGVDRAELVVPLARSLIGQAKQSELVSGATYSEQGLPPGTAHDLLLLKAGAMSDLGDGVSAMRAVVAARNLVPDSPKSWLAEVGIRSRAGHLAEARSAAERALQLQPNSAEALYLRGTVEHLQGKLDEAWAFYDQALRLQPDHLEGLVSRAGLFMDLARLDDVKRDVEAIRRVFSRDPRGAYLSAVLAERQRQPAAAKAALLEVTNLLDPVPVEFFRFRPQLLMLGGLAHFGLTQNEKAKPYLETLLRVRPGSPAAKVLAQIHIVEGNVDRATALLESYMRSHPADTQAKVLLASAHARQGRHARATALLRDATSQQDSPTLRNALGSSLLGAGKFTEAVPELQAGWASGSGQLQSGVSLVSVYLQLGEPSKALAIAEALVKRDPLQPGLQFLLGRARFAAGDLVGARSAHEAALRQEPRFIEPQVELARLDIRAKQFAAAKARLDRILAGQDRNVGALEAMAEWATAQRQPEEARRWLIKAEEASSPGDLDAGMKLVTFDLASSRIDRATESLARLTAKAPGTPRVLVMSARVRLAAGEADAAKSDLTRASGLVAYDVPALVQIAELQMLAGDTAGARHSLDKALQESPEDLRSNALRGQVDLRLGDLNGAEQRAKKLVSSRPRASAGHSLLGQVAASRGDLRGAVSAFRVAHQIEGSPASLLWLLAATYRLDPAAGLQIGTDWLKKHPRDLAVLRAVADGHARAGNFGAARAYYEQLIRFYPEDAEALNNLANVLILTKDDGAMKLAERALALKPDAAHIVSTTGWAAFHAGRADDALRLLRDARLRDPSNADTRFFLAAVLTDAGRVAEARQELEAALSLGKPFSNQSRARELLAQLR